LEFIAGDPLKEEWISWKTKMNKTYRNQEEEIYRFNIWKNNYDVIQNNNK